MPNSIILLILFCSAALLFFVVFLLMKILKRQKKITNKVSFQNSFSSGEPLIYSLLVVLWLAISVGIVFFLVRNMAVGYFLKSGLVSQIIQISIIVIFTIFALFQIFELLGIFRNKVSVNGSVLSITNKFGEQYEFTADQIISLRLGSRRRPNDCSLYIKFWDSSGRKRSFSMMLYWEPFLLFKLWANKYCKSINCPNNETVK